MSSAANEHSACEVDDIQDVSISGSEGNNFDNSSDDGEYDEDSSNDGDDSADDLYSDSLVEEGTSGVDVDQQSAPNNIDVGSIPNIIDGLSSEQEDVKNSSLERLAYIVMWEERLAEENIIPELAKIIQVLKGMTDSTLFSLLLDSVCSLARISDRARTKMVPYLQDIIPNLLNGDMMDRQNILQMLDYFAQEKPSGHSAIVDFLRDHIYTVSVSLPPEQIISAIEAFENVIIYGRADSRRLFLEAGVLEFLLKLLDLPSAGPRVAAQSCLVQMFGSIDEIHEDIIKAKPTADSTKAAVLNALLKCIADEDERVSGGAIQFFGADNEEVKQLLSDNPASVAAIVRHLGRKTSDIVGMPAEWVLVTLAEGEGFKTVSRAFEVTFSDDKIDTNDKLKIMSGLVSSFVNLRKAAMEGGLGEAMVEWLKDDQFRTRTLTILNKLMEGAKGSSISECCLAASVLTRLFNSYSGGEDSKPQREVVKERISSAYNLRRIIAVIYSSPPKVSGAVCHLIGELLLDEDGTESWMHDKDSGKPPPPTPLKDQIVTPELLKHAIGLLNHLDAAKEALYLLSQACWGNARGLSLTEMAFIPAIPDADVHFFASLYGVYDGGHAARQRRCVAEAAVKAGAIPRALELLESVSGSSCVIRAAVEGLRVLLTADSADRDIGRRSQSLQKALAMLLADETKESFDQVYWMLMLIIDDGNEWLNSWTEFASTESARHLVNMLEKHRGAHEEPKEEGMSQEEYVAAVEEYQKKVSDSEKQHQERGDTERGRYPEVLTSNLEADGDLLDVIVGLGSSSIDILIRSLKDTMARPTPPSASRYDDWIRHSPTMAAALYSAGISDRLLQVLAGESDADDIRIESHINAVCGLGKLVEQLGDESQARALQEKFFANEGAVAASLDILRDKRLLQRFEGIPSGVLALADADIVPALMKMFDREDEDLPGQSRRSSPLVFRRIEGSTPEIPSAGKNGRKKKKKKHYRPRISEVEVWLRVTKLSSTTDTARKAIVDAGVLDEAKFILESDDTDKWLFPLAFFEAVALDEKHSAPFIVGLLPRMNELLQNESAESIWPTILSVTDSILPKHVDAIVAAGIHQSVLKGLGEYPASFDGIDNLITPVIRIIGIAEGRQPMIDAMQTSMELENAEELELNWGYSYAFRRLVARGDVGAEAVVDAGGVGFALRLLRSDDVHVVTKGAELCTTLILSPSIESRVSPILEENKAAELMEAGRRKTLEMVSEPMSARRREKTMKMPEQLIKVLGGDREGYEEEL
ncbi:hypothetical protein BDQ17DRAFT_1425343 [Cyathus striatus]|nr:hypothetical protein BDQ17DRAFT_1425343 [Cyathus striatus]